MKPVLEWIKSNVLIVICAAVILIPAPVAYIFSSKWNAGIREGQQEKFDKASRTVRSASAVDYGLPAIVPDEPDLSESRAPNALVTAWYAQRLAERRAAVATVLDQAESINRATGRDALGDHSPLVPGLFPEPGSQSERIRRVEEFLIAVCGRGEGTPTAYTRMIDSIRGIGAPDGDEIARQLASQQDALLARLEADPSRDRQEISRDAASQLAGRRMGAYTAHAGQGSVYIEPSAFMNADIATESPTPIQLGLSDARERRQRQQSGNPVTPAECFVWQWDLWVMEDVLAAVDATNRVASSGAPGIPGAAVKRIERVAVSKLPIMLAAGPAASDSDDIRGSGRSTRGGNDPFSESSAVAATTHTGRGVKLNDESAFYDVRRATLVAVVASDRLPALLNELGRANLITVTDVDITSVDVIGDLRQGYAYGDDHVVRATIALETLWLRSWTAGLMPEPVRNALGVPEPMDADDSDSGDDADGG